MRGEPRSEGIGRLDRVPLAVGVDGARAGWVLAVAIADGADPARVRTELRLLRGGAPAILGPLAELEACGRPPVGIDMPMGLPDRAGLRPCDRIARSRLGARRSSVFAPLDRELLGLSFAEARARVHARRRAGSPGDPVMPHQSVALGAKIAVLDGFLRERAGRQRWVLEVHPELSFAALAGGEPPAKRTAPGAAVRRSLIGEAFPEAGGPLAARSSWPRSAAGEDDALDAYAVLWTALRHRAGEAERLGGELDAHGLHQQLFV